MHAADYVSVLYSSVLPSVPDFKWGFATANELDEDGYVLVTVTANGVREACMHACAGCRGAGGAHH
jgi:hypothetical protein